MEDYLAKHNTDADFFDMMHDIEREVLTERGDSDALAMLDAELAPEEPDEDDPPLK